VCAEILGSRRKVKRSRGKAAAANADYRSAQRAVVKRGTSRSLAGLLQSRQILDQVIAVARIVDSVSHALAGNHAIRITIRFGCDFS
jgi:hypothetical protein